MFGAHPDGDSSDKGPVIGFQIQTCCLLFLLSTLLPFPLVHVQQILAANGVNIKVSFEALLPTVVLGQAKRPDNKSVFKRFASAIRVSTCGHP